MSTPSYPDWLLELIANEGESKPIDAHERDRLSPHSRRFNCPRLLTRNVIDKFSNELLADSRSKARRRMTIHLLHQALKNCWPRKVCVSTSIPIHWSSRCRSALRPSTPSSRTRVYCPRDGARATAKISDPAYASLGTFCMEYVCRSGGSGAMVGR